MTKGSFKVADIAERTGLSARQVRDLLVTFGESIPSRRIGPVRLYDENAVGLIEEIASLATHGYETNEIMEELKMGGKKRHKIRPSIGPKSTPVQATQAPTIPTPDSAVVQPVPRTEEIAHLRETLAQQERQIKRLRTNLEEQVRENDEVCRRFTREIDEMQAIIEAQQAQIRLTSDWIDYFENMLNNYQKKTENGINQVNKWIAYCDAEIDHLKAPWTTKLLKKIQR